MRKTMVKIIGMVVVVISFIRFIIIFIIKGHLYYY